MKHCNLLLILLISLILSACSKPAAVDDWSKVFGEYRLVSANWTGHGADFNGNGTGYFDLMNEFHDIVGYYEPDYTSSITEGYKGIYDDNKRPISFNLKFPYPDYIVNNGKIKILGASMGKQTMRIDSKGKQSLWGVAQLFTKSNLSSEFLQSISMMQVTMSSKEDNKFDFIVTCTIPVGLSNNLTLETHEIIYTYEKIK